MKQFAVLILFIAFFVLSPEFGAKAKSETVFVVPQKVIISQNRNYSLFLKYTLTSNKDINLKLISSFGVLYDEKNKIIAKVDKKIVVNMKHGRALAYEHLYLSKGVIDKMRSDGVVKFIYKRLFVYNHVGLTALNLPVKFESGMYLYLKLKPSSPDNIKNRPAKITSLKLYLPNSRVDYDLHYIRFYADIGYENLKNVDILIKIDRKIVKRVRVGLPCCLNKIRKSFVLNISNLSLKIRHVLSLFIEKPVRVSSNECYFYRFVKIKRIAIVKPKIGSMTKETVADFRWLCPGCSNVKYYVLKLFDKANSKAVFSIKTKFDFVHIYFDRGIFKRGLSYYLKIEGYTLKGIKVAQSRYEKITLSKAKYVNGEILIVIKKQAGFSQEDAAYYKAKIEGMFKLKTLKMKLILLKTKRSIFDVIKRLKQNKNVIYAQPNYIFATSTDSVDGKFVSRLNRLLHLDAIHKRYTGKGVKVAVVDTGVDYEHRDLKNSVVYHKNFILNSRYKPEVHGTAVAGIIASYSNHKIGVAPKSKIIALRACEQKSNTKPEGVCYTLPLVRAIDTAIEKKADIVNMSFCSRGIDKLVSLLIKFGHNKKIVFVAPVGNSKHQKNVCFPASDQYVVAIGGYSKKEGFYPNKSVGRKSDILAFYNNIFTLAPNNQYIFLSGTSMSSAIVSGLLALYKQKNGHIGWNVVHPGGVSINKWEDRFLLK